MKVIKNINIKLKHIEQPIDTLDADLKTIEPPLNPKSGAYYIVGRPSSGKTSLWLSLILTKGHGYWRKFDKIFLFSNSLATLPLDKIKLPQEQVFNEYDEDELFQIIDDERESAENNNILIILDDCIKDLKGGGRFNKLILNRRHIIQNIENDKVKSGVMLFITSQVYNLLALQVRKGISDFILFKTSNKQELDAIKSELMYDLTPQQQNEVLKLAWEKKYGFLYIKINNNIDYKYFSNFDLIKI
jgi:hypothetical protein